MAENEQIQPLIIKTPEKKQEDEEVEDLSDMFSPGSESSMDDLTNVSEEDVMGDELPDNEPEDMEDLFSVDEEDVSGYEKKSKPKYFQIKRRFIPPQYPPGIGGMRI